MLLRDLKDCTLEELVPRALAIHSSLRPSSTQHFMSSTNFLKETLWFIPMPFATTYLLSYLFVQVHQSTCTIGDFPEQHKVRSKLGLWRLLSASGSRSCVSYL